MAALRPEPVKPPPDEPPPEDDERHWPTQPIWRWPTPWDPAAPWWDVLVEYNADDTVYVRWHADPLTDAGRAFVTRAGRTAGGHDYPARRLADGLEHCLAELIVATLGGPGG